MKTLLLIIIVRVRYSEWLLLNPIIRFINNCFLSTSFSRIKNMFFKNCNETYFDEK